MKMTSPPLDMSTLLNAITNISLYLTPARHDDLGRMPDIKSVLIGPFQVAATVQRRLGADPATDDVPVLAPHTSRPVKFSFWKTVLS